MFTNLSSTPSNCVGSGSCLYFTGRNNDTYVTVRNATTPPLDLRLVRAVKLPHAPQIGISCNGNQTQMYEHLISLLLLAEDNIFRQLTALSLSFLSLSLSLPLSHSLSLSPSPSPSPSPPPSLSLSLSFPPILPISLAE